MLTFERFHETVGSWPNVLSSSQRSNMALNEIYFN